MSTKQFNTPSLCLDIDLIEAQQLMYQINLCSPIYDELQDQSINLRVMRIMFSIGLLLLYIAYNCISFFLKKEVNNLRLQDKQSNQSKIQSLERSYKKWENDYLLSFGDHIISIGFAMTFSPFGFELFLATLFLTLKVIYQVRLHKWGSQTKFLKSTFRIVNMALLICAMVGLSRTGYDSSGNCTDSSYQLL